MVEICALASGSNGNCYYIGNEYDAIIVDAGIFYKLLLERAESVGLDVGRIRAVFISHEHSDHVCGAHGIGKHLQVPIYFSVNTFNNTYRRHRPDYVKYFQTDTECDVFGIRVLPFKKRHDAADPHSFTINIDGMCIGVMTDIGIADNRVIAEFAKCNAVFLESNYDVDMLWNGPYPYFLKQRVASEVGHLSNNQAFELASEYASPKLTHIFLSHISAENNTLEKANAAFARMPYNVHVVLTSRQAATPVVRLG